MTRSAPSRARFGLGRAALSFLVVLSVVPESALAGGGDPYQLYAAHPYRPDDPTRYLAGELGILGESYGVAELWVAYRHLHGLAVPEDPDAVFGPPSSTTPADAYGDWRSAREVVPGVEEIPPWPRRERQAVHRTPQGHDRYVYFVNCLDDAFITAAETLAGHVERYGAESRETAEWLRGQDLVFANCGDGRHVPEPLDDTWPARLRSDRDYQIAAALFYATDYAAAETRFRRIAADPESPWRSIADLVVARALARQERFLEAIEHLRKILENPERSELHDSARGLIGHFRYRSEPERYRAELAERLQAPEPPPDLAQALQDLHWTLEVDGEPESDLASWLRLLHRAAQEYPSVPADPYEAYERFSETGGVHWWLAAAMASWPPLGDTRPPDLARGLLKSAPPAEGPARHSLLYHRLRLEQEVGTLDTPENEAALEAALQEDLFPSDRNRFHFLYRGLADDLETYLQRSLHRPVVGGYGRYLAPVGAEADLPTDRVFDDRAAAVLNGLSPSRLLELSRWDGLPDAHRDRLAVIGWVRAVVLGERDLAHESAPWVLSRVPDLAADLRAFHRAPETERPFLAALALLRAPQAHLFLYARTGWAVDLNEAPWSGQAWWCAGELAVQDAPAVARVPSGDSPRIRTVQAMPLHFAPTLFAFADAHPEDPRVPEALHRLVRATRISCGASMGQFRKVSKEAFQRLKRDYPQSPWTEQTPYWFD